MPGTDSSIDLPPSRKTEVRACDAHQLHGRTSLESRRVRCLVLGVSRLQRRLPWNRGRCGDEGRFALEEANEPMEIVLYGYVCVVMADAVSIGRCVCNVRGGRGDSNPDRVNHNH